MLQPLAFVISCRKDPSAGRLELHDPGLDLGLQPSVRGSKLGCGGDRVQQPRVGQHGRVVDQDGDRPALALDNGHRTPRTGIGQLKHPAPGVDERACVRKPEADLQRRVAQRP